MGTNNKTDPVEALRCEALLGLKAGDPIARYGYFQNLTFVERSNGHVTMRDKHGNEKRVYEELFLKYAKLPNDPSSATAATKRPD